MSIVTMELVLSLLVAAATIAVFIRTRRMAALAKGLGVKAYALCSFNYGNVNNVEALASAEAQHETRLLRDYGSPPSWPIFIIAKYTMAFVDWLSLALRPAPIATLTVIGGLARAQILQSLTDLQIADALATRHKTAAELSAELDLNHDRLERVLKAAVGMGIFSKIKGAKDEPEKFRNNRLSAVLRRDHPTSICHLVTTLSMTGKPWMDQLTHGIRTKQTSCTLHELATGQQHFAWLAADPKRDQIFNSGMAQIDNVVAQALVADYDWNQHQRILDIGGCYGSLLRRILSRHQQPVGLLFDQPHVIEQAKSAWKNDPLAARITFAAGSFFEEGSMPAAQDHDIFMLREILHDWDDDDVLEILKSCRLSIGTKNAKLVFVENVLQGNAADRAFGTRLLDVHMLGALNGAQRSIEHYHRLLRQTGLVMGEDHIHTFSVYHC